VNLLSPYDCVFADYYCEFFFFFPHLPLGPAQSIAPLLVRVPPLVCSFPLSNPFASCPAAKLPLRLEDFVDIGSSLFVVRLRFFFFRCVCVLRFYYHSRSVQFLRASCKCPFSFRPCADRVWCTFPPPVVKLPVSTQSLVLSWVSARLSYPRGELL